MFRLNKMVSIISSMDDLSNSCMSSKIDDKYAEENRHYQRDIMNKLKNMNGNDIVIVQEEKHKLGDFMGYCKWFNNKLGYGFIRVMNNRLEGHDIFVHYSGLQPLNSSFKTLFKGEYIQFNVVKGKLGNQAVQITGVCGGPLMIDNSTASPQPFM